jgi:two-component system sensor histidine kinase UhpB
MTLKGRLIALVACALLISLVAGGVLIAFAAVHWVQSEIDADARLARQLVQARVAEANEETESPDRIETLLASLEAAHHLRARYLPTGRLPVVSEAAEADDDDRGEPAAAPSWLAPLLGFHETVQEIPMMTNGAVTGRIEISTEPATEIAKVWRLIQTGFLAIGVFSASTLALVALGLTRSLRPLGDLAAALSRIGGGDYSARVGQGGPAEIALIGRHFDGMAEQLERMRIRARALTAELLAVQERERRDIARDLHDELGPCLLAANLDTSALMRLNQAGRADAVENCARGLAGVLDRMQTLVRRMISRLHLESFEPFGLAEAAADLAGFWRDRCPEISWHVAAPDHWPELSQAEASPLLQIIREAVSNAVRHSGAANIFIDCEQRPDEIVIRIRDDGSGFSLRAGVEGVGGGYGLPGMRERIAALGGALDIDSAPGRGTEISARLPIRAGGLERTEPSEMDRAAA